MNLVADSPANKKNALKLSNFEAIIFDLDGTLVDSVPDLSLAINHALTQMKLPSVNTEQVRLWVGNGSRKLVERSLASLGVYDDARLQRLHKAFLTSYQLYLCAESALYPRVLDLLKHLASLNIPMGLVTNKPIEFVPALLSSLGINDFFDVLIGGDSLPEKKPSPMPLLHVAAQLNIPVDKCLMVGDSASDVHSAHAAAMPCLLLKQGYNQGQDLSKLKPDYLLADIKTFYLAVNPTN